MNFNKKKDSYSLKKSSCLKRFILFIPILIFLSLVSPNKVVAQYWLSNNNGIDYSPVNSWGNVGIGTTSPSTWFNTNASTGPTLQIKGTRPTLSLTPLLQGGIATIHFGGTSTNSEFHLNFKDGADPSLSLYSYKTGFNAFEINGKGINLKNMYNTNINFAQSDYGASNGILFNAYVPSGGAGFLTADDMAKYSFGDPTYGHGAGGIFFIGNGGNMDFMISPSTTGNGAGIKWGSPKLRIRKDGKVGIGTTNLSGDYNLFVTKGIRTEKVKVDLAIQSGWADYVFEPTYKLPSLSQVESFIKQNKHLPDVPSAKEVEKDGIDLAAMDATLLKKIEELTLYIINQEKRLDFIERENKALKVKMNNFTK